ncbi:MAG: hypothetical protein N2A99_06435 [Carnobacterium alterfunditum]
MNNVFVFFSSIGNIGLTTTVLAVADTLAKNTDSRVGVLNLNAWDDGTDYIEEPEFTLDQIKSRLTGKMFHNTDDLLGKFKAIRENLYVLAGNRDRRLDRLYSIEEVNYLIEKSKELFDIVLIDAGCHIDNALTAGALEFSDQLFLVLNQQDKSSKQFEQLNDGILLDFPILKKDLNLIMNNYSSRTYLPSDVEISKQIDVPLYATIPHVENAWLCEIEKKWSVLYDNKNFNDTIFNIVERLVEKSNVTLVEGAKKKKRGLFKMR